VPFAALNEHDRHIVRSLAGILRISVGLDRTHDGRVKKVSVDISEDDVVIEFSCNKKLETDLIEYAANDRKALLSDVMNKRLKIVSSKS
jgi:hypothetical protein